MRSIKFDQIALRPDAVPAAPPAIASGSGSWHPNDQALGETLGDNRPDAAAAPATPAPGAPAPVAAPTR